MTDMDDWIFGSDYGPGALEFDENINPCAGCPHDGIDCRGQCAGSGDDDR